MIKELVPEQILGHNTIVTSAPGYGTTSLLMYISQCLVQQDKTVLYFNSSRTIDREFILTNYEQVYKNVCFMHSSIDEFIAFIKSISVPFDYVVIDPCDSFLSSTSQFISIVNLFNRRGTKVLASGQRRIDPAMGGNSYSTLERLNKQLDAKNKKLFTKSIWIRKASGATSSEFSERYIDVFDGYKIGNDMIARYISRYSKTGCVLHI